jgi:hypothetical protein
VGVTKTRSCLRGKRGLAYLDASINSADCGLYVSTCSENPLSANITKNNMDFLRR